MEENKAFIASYLFVTRIDIEGGFSRDARDAGNWTGGEVGRGILRGTKKGISAAAYPNLNIEELSNEDIMYIYHRDYWSKIRGGDIMWPLNLAMFDAAVNCGVKRSIQFIQRTLNIDDDGIFGHKTLMAIISHSSFWNAERAISERERYYRKLKTFPIYGKGWISRLDKLKKRIHEPIE